MNYTIQVFGAFRDLVPSGRLEISVPGPLTAAGLKELLRAKLDSHGTVDIPALLQVSAVATEERILAEDEPMAAGGVLALLPPVCGG